MNQHCPWPCLCSDNFLTLHGKTSRTPRSSDVYQLNSTYNQLASNFLSSGLRHCSVLPRNTYFLSLRQNNLQSNQRKGSPLGALAYSKYQGRKTCGKAYRRKQHSDSVTSQNLTNTQVRPLAAVMDAIIELIRINRELVNRLSFPVPLPPFENLLKYW